MNNPHPGLKLNPDYPIYCCHYNVMYHDYDMTEAEIVARIGQEPPKYIVDEEMLLEMARSDALYTAAKVALKPFVASYAIHLLMFTTLQTESAVPTKRGVAYGHGLSGFDFVADELLEDAYIRSHPGNGYGL